MSKVLICDVETTGLDNYPLDVVLQVGISEVDIEKKTVKPIYDKVLGYDTKTWPDRWKKAFIFEPENSDLRITDIDKAVAKGDLASKIGLEVHNMLAGEKVGIYNVGFDYGKFLRYDPFNLNRKKCTILPCLMLEATDPCDIPNQWNRWDKKWPRLEEAVDILLDKSIKKELNNIGKYHDASFDTIASGWVLLELIENHGYKI